MSLLWAVPATAAAVGAGLVLILSRSVAAAAGELGDELRSLEQVRSAVHALRAQSEHATATVARLRAARAVGGR